MGTFSSEYYHNLNTNGCFRLVGRNRQNVRPYGKLLVRRIGDTGLAVSGVNVQKRPLTDAINGFDSSKIQGGVYGSSNPLRIV